MSTVCNFKFDDGMMMMLCIVNQECMIPFYKTFMHVVSEGLSFKPC